MHAKKAASGPQNDRDGGPNAHKNHLGDIWIPLFCLPSTICVPSLGLPGRSPGSSGGVPRGPRWGPWGLFLHLCGPRSGDLTGSPPGCFDSGGWPIYLNTLSSGCFESVFRVRGVVPLPKSLLHDKFSNELVVLIATSNSYIQVYS